MNLTHGLIQLMAGPFREPVVCCCHDREDRARYQHVVEVRHHKVGIMVLEVCRRDRKHQSREPTEREQHHERKREQHRCLERHRPTEHSRNPVEHLHASGYSDQHSREHEEHLTDEWHADREHVMSPNHEGQQSD